MRLEISAYPGLYSIRASDRRRCDSSRPQGLRPRSYTPAHHAISGRSPLCGPRAERVHIPSDLDVLGTTWWLQSLLDFTSRRPGLAVEKEPPGSISVEVRELNVLTSF